jgi:hypothetical protein
MVEAVGIDAELVSEVDYISPQAQPNQRIEGHLATSSPYHQSYHGTQHTTL